MSRAKKRDAAATHNLIFTRSDRPPKLRDRFGKPFSREREEARRVRQMKAAFLKRVSRLPSPVALAQTFGAWHTPAPELDPRACVARP